ncbi:hypothetical protein [Arthrobacter sp. BPSS-3]|uniref:hypothetical protein n=1 Tax=Arthrobacter sp. BPSS-3 TaxID=3366580 RepID=UPI0037DDA1EB
MTENEWAQTAPTTSMEAYPGTGSVTTADTEGSSSKKEAAKDAAADVKAQAADSAQNVAETAKTEAANVAGEVKSNAKDLLHQARTDLTAQAGTQQQKAAEGLHSISSELHTMANASDQPGVASDLIRQAAERSASVATWLENRDPGSLLNEVKSFARQRPGTFLLAAAGAGILAGRLGRSLQAGAPDTEQAPSKPTRLPSSATPPAQRATTPVQQETVIAAGSGDRFFDEPVLPGTSGPVSTRTLPSGTAVDASLRDDVPFPSREDGQL